MVKQVLKSMMSTNVVNEEFSDRLQRVDQVDRRKSVDTPVHKYY